MGLDRNRAAPTRGQKSHLNGTRCCPINIWCYNRICPSGQRLCFCRHHFIRFGRGCRSGDMAVALSRDVLPRWLTLPAALAHRAGLLPGGSSTNQVDGGRGERLELVPRAIWQLPPAGTCYLAGGPFPPRVPAGRGRCRGAVPQIRSMAAAASALSWCRGTPTRERTARVCSVAVATSASAEGSALAATSPRSRALPMTSARKASVPRMLSERNARTAGSLVACAGAVEME